MQYLRAAVLAAFHCRCGGMPHTILIRHVLLNVVCGWDDLQHMVRRSDYLFDAL